MLMYNLIEYSNNYSKTFTSSQQYYRDEPSLSDANAIEDFIGANNNSKLFKLEQKITCQTENNGR